jgi:hypothetical protein
MQVPFIPMSGNRQDPFIPVSGNMGRCWLGLYHTLLDPCAQRRPLGHHQPTVGEAAAAGSCVWAYVDTSSMEKDSDQIC